MEGKNEHYFSINSLCIPQLPPPPPPIFTTVWGGSGSAMLGVANMNKIAAMNAFSCPLVINKTLRLLYILKQSWFEPFVNVFYLVRVFIQSAKVHFLILSVTVMLCFWKMLLWITKFEECNFFNEIRKIFAVAKSVDAVSQVCGLAEPAPSPEILEPAPSPEILEPAPSPEIL